MMSLEVEANEEFKIKKKVQDFTIQKIKTLIAKMIMTLPTKKMTTLLSKTIKIFLPKMIKTLLIKKNNILLIKMIKIFFPKKIKTHSTLNSIIGPILLSMKEISSLT
jgi:hypothetical protein